ncbi:histidine kinase [Streptomyces tricolor]
MDDRAMRPGGFRPPDAIRGFSVSAGLTGLRRAVALHWMSMAAFGRSLAVCGAVSLMGPGLGLVPRAVAGVRGLAARQRELVRRWTGVEIPDPPGPLPAAPAGRSGVVARYRWIMSDPGTRREYVWVLTDPIAGGLLAFLPLALVLSGLWGVFLAFYGVPLSASWDGLWYGFVPVEGRATAVLAGVLGLLQLPLALWAAPRVVRRHALYTRAMLAPGESELMAGRIRHLAATRSAAVDTQMAEIRRIERDLHDGAQARLVAMGMTLDAAERLLETDPEAVRGLLAEARQSSSAALEELRDLVRGIHPPVLADRGLADAVRALAMSCPAPTEVRAELPGRPEMPVESAAYFAVSEILANVGKHAEAGRAWIDLRHERGALHITVTDDGHGGADAARGTGLRGIERRLATFDGVLAVSSPVGGPTMVTMEIPCALSSPKTTSC